MTECNGTDCPNASGQFDQTNTRDYTETSTEIYTETSSFGVGTVAKFFENNFYMLKTFEAETIADWVKRYPPDLVVEAMKVARKANARSLKYIERILENWEQEGIGSVELLKAREAERNGKRGQNNRNNKDSNEPDQYAGVGEIGRAHV